MLFRSLINGGSLQIRYLAVPLAGELIILAASAGFGPRRIEKLNDFSIAQSKLYAGQVTFPSIAYEKALAFLTEAIAGRIRLKGLELKLATPLANNVYSETLTRDRWEGGLHLQVWGESPQIQITADELLLLDYDLRR